MSTEEKVGLAVLVAAVVIYFVYESSTPATGTSSQLGTALSTVGGVAPTSYNGPSATQSNGAATGPQLVTTTDNPFTGKLDPNGNLSYSSYTDPATGNIVVEQGTFNAQPGGGGLVGMIGHATTSKTAPSPSTPPALPSLVGATKTAFGSLKA